MGTSLLSIKNRLDKCCYCHVDVVAKDHLTHHTCPAMASQVLWRCLGAAILQGALAQAVTPSNGGICWWHGSLLRSDGTRNCMAKSFLRKSKIPFNQLTGCSGTSTSPILFFLSMHMCEPVCVVRISSLMFPGEPAPMPRSWPRCCYLLRADSWTTSKSVRERTLIGIRGLGDLAFQMLLSCTGWFQE